MSAKAANQALNFECKIAELQERLGIPKDYALQHKLVLQPECIQPISIGEDIFGRDQRMAAPAAHAWHRVKDAAAADGIKLQPVSAFRSVDYQAGIIQRKLDAGQRMRNILQVSAAPGYSEHHSGCALDITTPGFEPLDEAFENSPAFRWLTDSASEYGFRLSYPRSNLYGVAYEPWHWCWHQASKT